MAPHYSGRNLRRRQLTPWGDRSVLYRWPMYWYPHGVLQRGQGPGFAPPPKAGLLDTATGTVEYPQVHRLVDRRIFVPPWLYRPRGTP